MNKVALWMGICAFCITTTSCNVGKSNTDVPMSEHGDPQILPTKTMTYMVTETNQPTILIPTIPSKTDCTQSNTTPTPRANHEMVYDQGRKKIVLFGGRDIGFSIPYIASETSSRHFTETWEYDECGWQLMKTEHSPPKLDDFDMVYDVDRQVTLLMGQYTPSKEEPLDDPVMMMWEYDGHDWTQINDVKNMPYPRIFSDMVFNSNTGQVVLFGGVSLHRSKDRKMFDWYGETWILTDSQWVDMTETLTYLEGYEPSGEFPMMVFDSTRGVFVLLSQKTGNITTEFDGISWDNLIDLPNQNGRPTMTFNRGGLVGLGGDMVFDTRRSVVVAHGLGGTWEYSGVEWVKVETPISPQSAWHAMAYDESRGVTVLFGGEGIGRIAFADTWEYDGVYWIQR